MVGRVKQSIQYHIGLIVWAVFFYSVPGFGVSTVRALLAENRLDDAIPLCKQFEVLATGDTDNYLACAWVYYRSDKVVSAERLLEKARKSYSTPEYQLLLALGQIKNKRYDEAKKIIEIVTKERKGSNLAVVAQELNAEIYELTGQLETAAFVYKQLLADDPKRGQAHWGLGRYYLGRSEQSRAIFHLEQTAKIWKKHVASRFNLGVIYASLNQLPQALRWLGSAHQLNRKDASVLEQIGLVYEKKKDFKESIRYWQKALAVNKDSAVAKEKLDRYLVEVIDALLDKKKYKEALVELKKATNLVSDQPKLIFRRGIANRNLGSYDAALGDLLAYSKLHGDDPVTLRELGICYLNLKLSDQAGSYFSKAVTVEPNNGMNYAWLGYYFEAKGDLESAIDAWRRALERMNDPKEIGSATRKISSIEKRIKK